MKIKCEVQQNTNTGNCNMDISFYCTTFRFFFPFFNFYKKIYNYSFEFIFLSPPNLCSYKNMVVNECLCNTITLLQYFFSELSFVIFPVFNYFWKITNLIVVDKHFSKSASSKITAGFFPPS